MSGQVSQVSHVRQSGKILFRILWIIFVFAEFGSKIESSQWVTEFGSQVLSAQKVQACFQAAGPLALRSSFGMVPTANLFQLRSSFRSAAKDEARDFSCHWSLDSLPTRFLRRTGHGMLRDWNMDKVHEVGWCIASALKATQRASKSSWFLACSSCFPVWPFAELLDEGCSFSDFVCMLCSALQGASVRKNPKHAVARDMGR